MTECKNCGVILDPDMSNCPLCGLAAGEEPQAPSGSPAKAQEPVNRIARELAKLNPAEKRKIFLEFCAIILGSGILVTTLINFVISGNLSWAKYNLVGSLVVFINIFLFTTRRKVNLLLFTGSFIATAMLLILLDLLSIKSGWGMRLGVPIVTSFYGLAVIVIVLIRNASQRGFNILAIVLLAAGVFLICLELIISRYFGNRFVLSWSLIATSSLVPLATLLFYMHYRLRKGIELKRFFHI